MKGKKAKKTVTPVFGTRVTLNGKELIGVTQVTLDYDGVENVQESIHEKELLHAALEWYTTISLCENAHMSRADKYLYDKITEYRKKHGLSKLPARSAA